MNQQKSQVEIKTEHVTEILGQPVGEETPTADGVGRFRHFQNGSIHWYPATGAHETHGAIRSKWAELGWERSFLGYPTTDEVSIPNRAFNSHGDLVKSPVPPVSNNDGQIRCSYFQHGAIVWRMAEPQRVQVFEDQGESYRRRLTQEEFKSYLDATLECKYMEVLKGKPHDKQFLTYTDIQALAGITRNVFRNKLGKVPADIDFQCNAAEAVLAPDLATKIQHVKAMAGVAGGVVGLVAILHGLALIFGWGAGVLATIKAFFIGAAVSGPIGWIVAGVAIAAIATYFALTSDDADKSAKAFKALKGVVQSVERIWPQYGEALSK